MADMARAAFESVLDLALLLVASFSRGKYPIP